jgi:hypothetical protein
MKQAIHFIGIGAQKSGTSWISKMLVTHPAICFSISKEVHFFDKKPPFPFKKKKNYYPDFNWHYSHFSHAQSGQLLGEFTPMYLYDASVAKKIFTHNPHVKLIVSLRDPVKRTYSHYKMLYHTKKLEQRSFEDAIKAEPEYVERGMYFKQLKPYYELFPPEQIHVVLFEDSIAKPNEVWRNLCSFLQIDSNKVPTNLNIKQNVSQNTRLGFISELQRIVPQLLIKFKLKKLLLFLKKTNLNTLISKLNEQRGTIPPIEQKTKEALAQLFEPDIQSLEKLLGITLDNWTRLYHFNHEQTDT